MKIYQVLPVVAFGDAVGNEAVSMDSALKEAGYKTQIYADGWDERIPKGIVKHFNKLKVNSDDIIIYHLATGNHMNYDLDKFKCKKVIRYHNITPPSFFLPYNRQVASICDYGYKGVKFLSDKADYILADSQYNLDDLRNMNYKCPGEVIPIILSMDDFQQEPDQSVVNRYSNDGYTNILFTGRIAPNKKHEDIIRSFYFYKKFINEKSRLIFVGNSSGMERYYNKLESYISELELEDVLFTGHISFKEILAYYTVADLFLCLSEHEGFCVPLIEAMFFKKPIIAFDSSAIKETLGDAGIVIENKDPNYVAEWMNEVLSNNELQQKLLVEQEKRLTFFSRENVKDKFVLALKNILNI